MIPKVLHLIWIARTQPFGYLEYWCVVSAVKRCGLPVILHTDLTPTTNMYNPHRIEGLTIRMVEFDNMIKGKKAEHIAHLCDWYRLNLAYKEGGIIADIDEFWLKDISHLCELKAFSCYQHQGYKVAAIGVFGCAPKDASINLMIDAYQVSKTYWKFANMYPYIGDNPNWTILKRNTFYPWTNGNEAFLEGESKGVKLTDALGVQLWAHKYRFKLEFDKTPLKDSWLDLDPYRVLPQKYFHPEG